MHQTKFVILLGTLSAKEFNDFERYLLAFYPKRIRDLFVFRYIADYKKDLSSSELDINYGLNNHFIKENISRENLTSNVLPKLYQFLEEFLIGQEIKRKKNFFQKEKILLDIFKQRDLDKLFENKLKILEKKLNKEHKNMWSYLNQFEVSFISYFAFSNENNSIKNDIMLPVFENLDGAYITSLLKLACEQKFRERVIPSNQITIEFLPQVLELVKKKEIYYKNQLIQIYLILLDLIENPNDNRYEKLKVLVKNNYIYEEKEDQPLLYVFVLNYIAGELKKGRSKYINEAKDWVVFGLESKMFLEEGYITPVVFSNMIRICCGTENVESAENMIQNYAHIIKLKYRKDTLLVAQSYIYMVKRKFEKIIIEIDVQKINHRIMNLQARLILLRALGEIKDWVAFKKFIDACNNSFYRTGYLGRANKLSALNTLKYAEKLANPNIDKIKFTTEVENLEFIFCKSWLLKQINTRRF